MHILVLLTVMMMGAGCGGGSSPGEPGLLGSWRTTNELTPGFSTTQVATFSGSATGGTTTATTTGGPGTGGVLDGCTISGQGTGTWTWLSAGRLQMTSPGGTSTNTGCTNAALNVTTQVPPTDVTVSYTLSGDTLTIGAVTDGGVDGGDGGAGPGANSVTFTRVTR